MCRPINTKDVFTMANPNDANHAGVPIHFVSSNFEFNLPLAVGVLVSPAPA